MDLLEPTVRMVMIADQGGKMSDGALSPDFRSQVRRALMNLATAAQGAGASVQDIVKHAMLVVDFDETKLHIVGEELAQTYTGTSRQAR